MNRPRCQLTLCKVLLASLLALAGMVSVTSAQTKPAAGPSIEILQDEQGFQLQVDGKPFHIRGMNWGYIPIGHNYSYSLWTKSDAFIREVLESEMTLMQKMGINAIRQYDDVPPRWVTYIYENYGIFTMVNNTMGRYGVQMDGGYIPRTNYQDPKIRAVLKERAIASLSKYKDTPGLLMYLLGNENNYGLEWSSFEIENLPEGERHRAKAEHLYSLFGELIREIKRFDDHHPVAIANGDLQYMDLIAKYCPEMDILGSNVYRGISSRDLFQRTLDELDKPFVYTEFGADAYNAKESREDALNQAIYLLGLWQEIDEMSYGKGRVGNALGGFTFQWSDGWWKTGQETNLDVQDTTASWANGGYPYDLVEGQNNMNEEWWGICAKGPEPPGGVQPLYPRTAYYALKKAYTLNVTDPSVDLKTIRAHYEAIDLVEASTPHGVGSMSRRMKEMERFRVSNLRLEFSSFFTGNSDTRGQGKEGIAFDHMQSFYVGFESRPTDSIRANVDFNILGNVASNPIDETFYESRGRRVSVEGSDGEPVVFRDRDRVQVYGASFDWKENWFELEGFYRTGHYHWGYEGDFFGLYREANYQDAIDRYNANAPSGVVFTGKKGLQGLKLAAGPELYWGANPMVLAKYYRTSGRHSYALLHQEDITRQGAVLSSAAVPEQVTRKSTAYYGVDLGSGLVLELGGVFAGSEKVGRGFQYTEESSDARTYLDSGNYVLEDTIQWADTLGGKGQLQWDAGPFKIFTLGGYQGLVADAGGDYRQTWTGWMLKPTGRGNHYHAGSGFVLQMGDFQMGPNVLYQRPLIGPMPSLDDRYSSVTNTYFPGLSGRNILDDPFVVLENRETLGFEFVLTYDPTPATWLWMWDNDRRENASFAGSLNVVYRMQPTSRDASLFFLENGTIAAFASAPSAQDVWDVNARFIIAPSSSWKVITRLYAGTAQGNGEDDRLILRTGGDTRWVWEGLAVSGFLKFNDWGPYDFHRDFNLTYPVQMMGDISYGTRTDILRDMASRFGIRVKHRYLDAFSPPGITLPTGDQPWANETEVLSYFRLSL